jgi:hypothetical protein
LFKLEETVLQKTNTYLSWAYKFQAICHFEHRLDNENMSFAGFIKHRRGKRVPSFIKQKMELRWNLLPPSLSNEPGTCDFSWGCAAGRLDFNGSCWWLSDRARTYTQSLANCQDCINATLAVIPTQVFWKKIIAPT